MTAPTGVAARIAYMPALHWRQAEMAALDGVENTDDLVAPLLTLKRPGIIDPPDPTSEVEARFLEPKFEDLAATQFANAYVDRVADQISEIAFGSGRLGLGRPLPYVYCDTGDLDAAAGFSQMTRLIARIDGPAVPVWRSRTYLPRLVEALRLGADGRGLAARIVLGDILGPSGLPSELRQAASSVDLILDLSADVVGMSLLPAAPSWFERWATLIASRPWRRVILLAGGFPQALPRYGTFEWSRACKKMHVAFARWNSGRPVIRGDYACVYPNLIESYGGSHNPNLRYAWDDVWVIHRAPPVPPGERSPYWELSKRCADHNSFKSSGYSKGDEAIYATSREQRQPGWAKSGLFRSISHHLQVATLEAQLDA